jgi:signal peptidase II
MTEMTIRERLARLAFVLIILVTCVGCDQITKSIAKQSLNSDVPIHLLQGIVQLEYAENPGATLSMGADLPAGFRFAFFGLVTGLVLVAAIYIAVRVNSLGWLQLLGISCVAAGGLGNYLDRLFHGGSVRDFVSLGIGFLRTGIFNAADVAIMAGGILFIWISLRERGQPAEAEEQ